jgi:hypothetical protein
VRLEQVLVDYAIPDQVAEWKSLQDGLDQVTLQLRLPRHHLRGLLNDLVDLPEVKKGHRDYVEPPAST